MAEMLGHRPDDQPAANAKFTAYDLTCLLEDWQFKNGGAWARVDQEDHEAAATAWGQCDFTGFAGDPDDYAAVAYHVAVDRHDKSFCLLMHNDTHQLVKVPWNPTEMPTRFPKAHIKRVKITEVVQPVVTVVLNGQAAPHATGAEINDEMAYQLGAAQRELALEQERSRRLDAGRVHAQKELDQLRSEHRKERDAANAAARRSTRRRVAAALLVGLVGGVAGTLSMQSPSGPAVAEKKPDNPPAGTSPYTAPPVLEPWKTAGHIPPHPDDPIPRLDHREFGIGPEAHPVQPGAFAPPGGQMNRDAAARLAASLDQVRREPMLQGGLTWSELNAMGITYGEGAVHFQFWSDDKQAKHVIYSQPMRDTIAKIGRRGNDIVLSQAIDGSAAHKIPARGSVTVISPNGKRVETIDLNGATKDPPEDILAMQWPKKTMNMRDWAANTPAMRYGPGAEQALRERKITLRALPGQFVSTGAQVSSTVAGVEGVEITLVGNDVHILFVNNAFPGYTKWIRYIVDPSGAVRTATREVHEFQRTVHPGPPHAGDGILTEPPSVAGFDDHASGWYYPTIDNPPKGYSDVQPGAFNGLYPIGMKPPRVIDPVKPSNALPVAPAPRPVHP